MPLTKIATKSDLPTPGRAKEFTVGDKIICVANVEGECSAMDNVCLHRGGPLGEGNLSGSVVTCPWHGWKFDVRTGSFTVIPTLKVTTYKVREQEGSVMVEVP